MLSKDVFSNDDLKCIISGSKFHSCQDRIMATELLYVRKELDNAWMLLQEVLPRHAFSQIVNELRDVDATQCKREVIIGILNNYGITAKPV